jgi:hypothetical protein
MPLISEAEDEMGTWISFGYLHALDESKRGKWDKR